MDMARPPGRRRLGCCTPAHTPLYRPYNTTRSELRFIADAVAVGGWRHEETEAFIEWASHYEDGSREGRTRAKHEAWLAKLPCPVLRLDGSRPLAELVTEVASAIER